MLIDYVIARSDEEAATVTDSIPLPGRTVLAMIVPGDDESVLPYWGT